MEIIELEKIYPNETIFIVGENFIIGIPEEIEIIGEIRWPAVEARFKNNEYIIKFVPIENTIEEFIYEKLKDDVIAPKLIDKFSCIVYDELELTYTKMTALLIEKYDGNFLDMLLEIDPSPDQMDLILKVIIDKNLKLNLQYGIRHGDLSLENIVYRKSGDKIEIRFIDFELSSIYDMSNQLLKTGVRSIANQNYFNYNPYYDLLNFIYSSYDFNIYIKFPPKYELEYLSRFNEADLDRFEEIRQMIKNKPYYIYNI